MNRIGNAKAFIAAADSATGKAQYIYIGAVFKKGEEFVLKIDSLPLPGCGWQGWVNIFPDDKKSERPTRGGDVNFEIDDDIPF